jgi:low affinity Fe/Cu permease
LIVNTATTVLTFLAVFLIQNSQNRDGAAMQAKLDEILRALDNAREEFVGIEHLTDAQIGKIRDALEADIRNAYGKDKTARSTVESLLKRY